MASSKCANEHHAISADRLVSTQSAQEIPHLSVLPSPRFYLPCPRGVAATPGAWDVAGDDSRMDLLNSGSGLGLAGIVGSADCTPGYYNNEGQQGGLGKELLLAYPGGPVAYFEYLKGWCAKGDFEGLDFR